MWASTCAERVLHLFEDADHHDLRPRNAVEGAVSWANGLIEIGEARRLALAAHAAARDATDPAAVAAARSAGHAAAVAHMAGHARHAADYAVKAISVGDVEGTVAASVERRWQRVHVPGLLRSFVYPSPE